MASAGPDDSRLSAEQEAALSALVAHADLVAGDTAVVRRRSLTGLAVDVIDVAPHNPRAASVTITAEHWLIVVVGRGRWELDYSDTDIALAKRLMDAAVFGHVRAAHGERWSRTTVTLEDGTRKVSDVQTGLFPLLRGRRRPGMFRGPRVRYEPFAEPPPAPLQR
ncbi:hypothetical protein ACO03V_03575 [Microbacterium sp. HMH0099]|uniref:hypothetical protein n=1 Tax=Microbacterium sp. HMH0099 TaxID=3414026 RepID=UPI003BF6A2E1